MPPSYTAAQKGAISQYVALTQTDKTTAAKLLKQFNWDVQQAANAFFSGNANVASNPHKSKLTKLFDSYRENPTEEPDEVNMEGMGKMMQDMKVDMESTDLLIFSELVQSPTLGKITREGFVDGLSQQAVSDSAKISALINQRSSVLSSSDRATLKKVYKHTFTIAKAQGSKSIPLDSAIEFWRLLFSPPSLSWSTPNSPWLDWWIEFLEAKWKKSVNKDMWDQTLSFAFKTLEDESMSWWSEDSAWPGVIDEFVAWVKEKRGGEEMDTS
ncbi:Cullin binding-domain-containing protein [Elsinoe ampelina]|uniref:Defective in cullin neddylation protein n=1 Tax=Elsinoe ampelina TaxID=302913 RepID=A0A6A6GK75_9PEZI|nr:Cullin binding-domain-containing protein [Elsinoe ampelina]